jgi:hypothetical protein
VLISEASDGNGPAPNLTVVLAVLRQATVPVTTTLGTATRMFANETGIRATATRAMCFLSDYRGAR